jgi:hypothetical protein
MADVETCVVVIHVLPMMGNFMGMTGPAARMAAKVGYGFALNAAPSMSKRSGVLKSAIAGTL